MIGKIKFFDTKKGYGFIVSGKVKGDIFVHYTKVLQDGPIVLNPGDKVDFELDKDQNGRVIATRVSKIS